MCQTEELTIRFAKHADTTEVIALWNVCFPGEERFRDYFFSQLYHPKYNLLLHKGNVLCAMAQMLPCEIQNGVSAECVTYIYGACTHPSYRRQHLMDRLLHHSFTLDQEQGRAASILIPQESWLFKFYAQFGYYAAFENSIQTVTHPICVDALSIRSVESCDLSELDGLYHQFLRSGPYIRRTEAEWHRQLSLFQNTGGEVLCSEQHGKITGYAFVYPSTQEILAQELVCLPDIKESWIAALQQRYHQIACRIMGLQFSNPQPFGCMRRYDQTHPAGGYINLMLN